MCQQTAEYLVPCSTQSQFPYLWSAALRCTHGMAILGDPGADEMGVPSRSCNPRERNWEPLPIPPMSRPPPRAPRVSPAPAALQGRCPPSPAALGEPRPHARFQERLSDLAAAARSNMRTIHTPHRDNPSCL